MDTRGYDQNDGVKFLKSIDEQSPEAKYKCLALCWQHSGATGCEVILNGDGLDCYFHTKSVARGGGATNHWCWVFSKCSGK